MIIKPTGEKDLNPHIEQLKPFKIPEGMIIIIDTREQLPLFNKLTQDDYTGRLEIINQKLDHGDYSIKGFEDKFVVERKQISDFYSYIGKERKRTVKKMKALREIIQAGGFAMLAIECDEAEVLAGNMFSTVPPEVARGALNSFRVRYGVHIYFHRERKFVERVVLDSMIKFYNVIREV